MLTAFLLGFTGSFAHCIGMCSGIGLLLSQRHEQARVGRGWRILILHLGRLTTYCVLGALAGVLSYAARTPVSQHSSHTVAHVSPLGFLPGLTVVQGALALLTALVAIYMAVALLGYAPSPEVYLSRLTRGWGSAMRKVTARNRVFLKSSVSELLSTYSLGLLWGLLPCGLVLAALLTATVAGSPGQGALTMLFFGLGTAPMGMSIALSSAAARWRLLPNAGLRPVAAVVLLVFGLQMALRGSAAWGWVAHFHLGELMLW